MKRPIERPISMEKKLRMYNKMQKIRKEKRKVYKELVKNYNKLIDSLFNKEE